MAAASTATQNGAVPLVMRLASSPSDPPPGGFLLSLLLVTVRFTVVPIKVYSPAAFGLQWPSGKPALVGATRGERRRDDATPIVQKVSAGK